MASSCATLAPTDHPLLLLRMRMEKNEHKYRSPSASWDERVQQEDLPPTESPPSPGPALLTPPPSFQPATSPPPTPGRPHPTRNGRAVDVSGLPAFFPSANRKRRLLADAAGAPPRPADKAPRTKTGEERDPPPAPPTFRLSPQFLAPWLAEVHAELSRDRTESDGSGDESKDGEPAESAAAAAPAPLAIPYAPSLGSRTTSSAERPVVHKLGHLSLGSRVASGGAKGKFRKRTGLYARGA